MRLVVPWLALCLGACTTGGSQPTGALALDADLVASSWVTLDLTSGTVTSVTGPVDDSAPEWRGTRMLFRQIPAGDVVLGRAVADVNAEDNEHPPRRTQVGRMWMAVHEMTQAQWLALATTRPWQAVLPVPDPSAWIGDDQPAFGISPRLAEYALSRITCSDGWLLDLPEADEWERACLAGTTGKFAWGDSLDESVAADWAVCKTTVPLPVGGRNANAWGMHDMHGNVWEIVRTNHGWQARGGAWDQPVITTRASNQAALGTDTVGWNVGLRLVLRR